MELDTLVIIIHEQNFTSFWYRLVRYDGTDSSDTMVPNAVL